MPRLWLSLTVLLLGCAGTAQSRAPSGLRSPKRRTLALRGGGSDRASASSLRRARSEDIARGGAGFEGDGHAIDMDGDGVIDGAEVRAWLQKTAISSLVLIAFEIAFLHYCEAHKILMQASDGSVSHLDIHRKVTAKGWHGMYDGFFPWGLIMVAFKGAAYGAGSSAAASVLNGGGPLGKLGGALGACGRRVAAGAAGGFAQGGAQAPWLLVMSRCMTDPRFTEVGAGELGPLAATALATRVGAEMIRDEGGFGALLNGAGFFALKRLLDYFFAVLFTDMFEGIVRCVFELRAPTPPANAANAKRGAANDPPPLSDQLAVACSLGGGLLSSVVTLPADVIVAQLMSTEFKGANVNPLVQLSANYQSGKLFRGMRARLFHFGFSAVALIKVAPIVVAAVASS